MPEEVQLRNFPKALSLSKHMPAGTWKTCICGWFWVNILATRRDERPAQAGAGIASMQRRSSVGPSLPPQSLAVRGRRTTDPQPDTIPSPSKATSSPRTSDERIAPTTDCGMMAHFHPYPTFEEYFVDAALRPKSVGAQKDDAPRKLS